jgi:hypothetical protein
MFVILWSAAAIVPLVLAKVFSPKAQKPVSVAPGGVSEIMSDFDLWAMDQDPAKSTLDLLDGKAWHDRQAANRKRALASV